MSYIPLLVGVLFFSQTSLQLINLFRCLFYYRQRKLSPLGNNICHCILDTLIADSIGNPTTEKISQVLESYNNTKLHLIGCFIEENLIGIIGIEVLPMQAIIKHISVLKTFRSQGIGKQLILYIISHFALKRIIVETDDDAVDFYRALGFNCEIFEGKYNQRYNCTFHLQ